MKFLYNPSTDAPFNLALEELLPGWFNDELFMLWRNRNAVIVGRNQNSAAEIDGDFVRQHNIQVVRRMTGGGAVYHDCGNINFTIVANNRQLEAEAFTEYARPVLEVLKKFGVPAEFSGRNDILADQRKISGSARTVLRNRTLFHGTLLFSADLSMLGKVLTPDPDKIRAKGIKSVRSRVANICEFLPNLNVEEFLKMLQMELIRETGAEEMAIPPELLAQAEKLADEKYRTWQWNYGSVSNYAFSGKKRFEFGTVQADFNVADNTVADLKISGDFFGNEDVSALCAAINGLSLEPSVLAAEIKKIPVADYIHGASAEDIVSLFEL